MDFGWFAFQFEGRINRAKYWLSILIFLVGVPLFLMMFSGDVGKLILLEHHRLNGDDITISTFIPFLAIGVPMLAVGAWIFAATAIKRLHDRNKSAWWAALFFLMPIILHEGSDWIHSPNLSFVVGYFVLGLNIWGFVETYCLKGTSGPNRFGPDPLSPQKRVGRLMAHR